MTEPKPCPDCKHAPSERHGPPAPAVPIWFECECRCHSVADRALEMERVIRLVCGLPDEDGVTYSAACLVHGRVLRALLGTIEVMNESECETCQHPKHAGRCWEPYVAKQGKATTMVDCDCEVSDD